MSEEGQDARSSLDEIEEKAMEDFEYLKSKLKINIQPIIKDMNNDIRRNLELAEANVKEFEEGTQELIKQYDASTNRFLARNQGDESEQLGAAESEPFDTDESEQLDAAETEQLGAAESEQLVAAKPRSTLDETTDEAKDVIKLLKKVAPMEKRIGGNGSKSFATKKQKHNLKKPWPTRSSRKPNGKGRKTRSQRKN